MASPSHTKYVDTILEAKYDTTLVSFLRVRREAGQSYDQIARDLHDLTEGVVSVTANTIRNWINDLEAVA